jgi:hypothetical protein
MDLESIGTANTYPDVRSDPHNEFGTPSSHRIASLRTRFEQTDSCTSSHTCPCIETPLSSHFKFSRRRAIDWLGIQLIGDRFDRLLAHFVEVTFIHRHLHVTIAKHADLLSTIVQIFQSHVALSLNKGRLLSEILR